MALRAAGYETVMVNCNPETVSTDYDTADRLYFEPLTFEDVLEVFHAEDTLRPGGRRAGRRRRRSCSSAGRPRSAWPSGSRTAGVPIVGTSPESIHLAEDRGAFGALLARGRAARARRTAPPPRTTRPRRSPTRSATRCWSGRPTCSAAAAWRSSTTTPTLRDYIGRATDISPEHPVLVDRFLDDAIEIDVDALCDATGEVYLGGVMEHIEEAGIHSGDSACALPPITLAALAPGRGAPRTPRRSPAAIGVRGLLNVQYALKDDALYVLEANPRASRTVPFVSKATAVPLAKAAARIMLGATIAELRAEGLLPADRRRRRRCRPDAPIAVKEAVLPFKRFRTPAGRGRRHRCSARR